MRGTDLIGAIYRGTNPVSEVYRGSSLIWTAAPIFDGFDGNGMLSTWINELLSEDLAALISDELGQLFDGLGALIGSTVAFVQNARNQIGQLVTHTGTALVDAYCAAWGGTAPPAGGGITPTPEGLIGLINGIPLLGPYLSTALTQIIGIIDDPATILSLIGTIPVVGKLATAIGLLPDEVTGIISPPINFVVDQVGAVLGTITCGVYTASDIEAVPEEIQYVIGQVANRARMLVPDGILSLDVRTSRFRWPTPLTNDDGFIEVRLADAGNGRGMKTQVFRRYSDTGYHQGTGLQFLEGHASIVHRVSDADVISAPGITSCAGGDRFRLVQSGSTHTLFKNGIQAGDPVTGISAPGSGSRSVGMLMMAGRELLGPRQYSPSLDYLEAA